jgi:hypothetical protein
MRFLQLNRNYLGLDILRGLGIFTVVFLHSAFYYFSGIWDVDFVNPPVIVTIIGFLLMFAGMFAIISGAVHTIQISRSLYIKGMALGKTIGLRLASGLFIMVVAYIYFIFTGPGIVHFENKTMNNSVFVELIRNSHFRGFNLERLLYIDSLVMIAVNIILVSLIIALVCKCYGNNKINTGLLLFLAVFIFAFSIIRIPMYSIYMNSLDKGDYITVLLLNWFVNKNNPILPFLGFALMGAWVGITLEKHQRKSIIKILPISIISLVTGVCLYIFLPDTMLERNIDLKWYSIMVAQLGLFLILILISLWKYDLKEKKNHSDLSFFSKFLYRFGIAGLTVFFVESIFSAMVYRVLKLFFPRIGFNISQSLLYGFVLAVFWGSMLILWERAGYKYGIEYFYCKYMRKFGHSTKALKLGFGE